MAGEKTALTQAAASHGACIACLSPLYGYGLCVERNQVRLQCVHVPYYGALIHV